MAKYREKLPEIIVDIDVCDPANGKPHTAVAITKLANGSLVGSIHMADGSTIDGIRFPIAVVTYPSTPPKFAVFKVDEVDAFYEPTIKKPVKVDAGKKLSSDNEKDPVPTV